MPIDLLNQLLLSSLWAPKSSFWAPKSSYDIYTMFLTSLLFSSIVRTIIW